MIYNNRLALLAAQSIKRPKIQTRDVSQDYSNGLSRCPRMHLETTFLSTGTMSSTTSPKFKIYDKKELQKNSEIWAKIYVQVKKFSYRKIYHHVYLSKSYLLLVT